MSKNINQVYTANPITSNASTDLMYFGQSPYGAGNDAAMTYANFSAQFGVPYTAAALTSSNDTNVTLTLGGTPNTALLHATSITAGWAGQLAITRGGTGISSFGTGVQTALGQNVTGSGGIVLATSPTLVTPTLGAASATSISFSSTTGIIGTTTNNNAAAGSVGEFISSVVADSTVSLTSNTNTDVTSISLTAGDWNVWGNVAFNGNAATSVIINIGWISTTSATLPASNLYSNQFYSTVGVLTYSIASTSFVVPYQRISIAGTTTVYLSVRSAFTVNTSTAGGAIYARRIR